MGLQVRGWTLPVKHIHCTGREIVHALVDLLGGYSEGRGSYDRVHLVEGRIGTARKWEEGGTRESEGVAEACLIALGPWTALGTRGLQRSIAKSEAGALSIHRRITNLDTFPPSVFWPVFRSLGIALDLGRECEDGKDDRFDDRRSKIGSAAVQNHPAFLPGRVPLIFHCVQASHAARSFHLKHYSWQCGMRPSM